MLFFSGVLTRTMEAVCHSQPRSVRSVIRCIRSTDCPLCGGDALHSSVNACWGMEMKVTVVVTMTVMMIDAPLPLPADCRETASSVKALFLWTPSLPAMWASVSDLTSTKSHPISQFTSKFNSTAFSGKHLSFTTQQLELFFNVKGMWMRILLDGL